LAATWLPCLALLAGCGDLTSGGVGAVEVTMVSDSLAISSEAPAAHGPNLPFGGSGRAPAGVDEPPPIQGAVTVQLQTYVRSGTRDWVELTSGIQEVTFPIHGGEAAVAMRTNVPSGLYTEVQNRFWSLEVHVEGGLVVDGTEITGLVRVEELEPLRPLALTRPIQLDVGGGAPASIVVELRAGIWLRRLDPVAQQVPREEFEEAHRVREGR
jgi:hypothetical protein